MIGILTLKNVTELKAYLGEVNYYHNYLSNLSSILEPIHSLMKMDTAWRWNASQCSAFKEKKK